MVYLDNKLLLWINNLSGKFKLLDNIMELLASDYLVPVLFMLALISFWITGDNTSDRKKHQIGVLIALISMGLCNWAVYIINGIYFRPRPFETHEIYLLFYQPTDSSFPSNSAAFAFAIATTILLINKKFGITLYCIAVLYGTSRIFAGIHYPIDIIGSAFLSWVIVYTMFKLKPLMMPILNNVIRIAKIFCLA